MLDESVSIGDLPPHNSAKDKKRYLIFRFCVAAILVTSLVVLGMAMLSYHQIRKQGLDSNLQQFAQEINAEYFSDTPLNSIAISVAELSRDWSSISKIRKVNRAALFDNSQQLLWTSEDSPVVLSTDEQSQVQTLIDDGRDSLIIDDFSPRLSGFIVAFGESNSLLGGLVTIRNETGNTLGVLKVTRDYGYVLQGAKQAVSRIALYVLGANLLLFTALFFDFRRGLKTIDAQEEQMNKQIFRLSNLLSINKMMQKSMKSASSRAVELNEQFLRRVGSDLHDGPAQSIGYAILRLDRLTKNEASSELKQEVHVLKEALDNSLTEIRGISSGLVLPELEQMTMEQCFKTVVSKHAQNSDTDVREYYQDLPDNADLPIKICAYRFVQEGLNNAHRHGRAKKCSVSAYVKDGVLHLSLKDNGMGFRKSQLSSGDGNLGLMGLKDRIESLGGRFSINSELGVGTAIKVSITLVDED